MRNRNEGAVLFWGIVGAFIFLGWLSVLPFALGAGFFGLAILAPNGFARLEPDVELRRRLLWLNYGTTGGFVFFLLAGDVFPLGHPDWFNWITTLALWVILFDTFWAIVWFRVIRIRATRRLEGSVQKATTLAVLLIATFAIFFLVGSCAVRPRMERWHRVEKENEAILRWVSLVSGELENSTITLKLRNYSPTDWPAFRIWILIEPTEKVKDWITLPAGAERYECKSGECRIEAKLPPSLAGTDPASWEMRVFIEQGYYWWKTRYSTEFVKHRGGNVGELLESYQYNLFTDEESKKYFPHKATMFSNNEVIPPPSPTTVPPTLKALPTSTPTRTTTPTPYPTMIGGNPGLLDFALYCRNKYGKDAWWRLKDYTDPFSLECSKGGVFYPLDIGDLCMSQYGREIGDTPPNNPYSWHCR